MKIFRKRNLADKTIYVSDTDLDETPDGFISVDPIYHVRKAKTGEKFDYEINVQGTKKKFVFTTESGRVAAKSRRVLRTASPEAVTNPACMLALELKPKNLQQELERLTELELKAEQAANEQLLEIPQIQRDDSDTDVEAPDDNPIIN